MKKKTFNGEECPVARSLEVIGDRWSLLIVRNAFDGMRRFSEFQKDLGLSKSVLANRLRSLVAENVLEIVPGANDSAYQEYALTAKGRDLFHIIVGLRQWGEDHLFRPDESHSVMVDIKNGRPIGRLELRSEDRRFLLGAQNTIVKKVLHASTSRRTTRHREQ